jgi:hypothetical protein
MATITRTITIGPIDLDLLRKQRESLALIIDEGHYAYEVGQEMHYHLTGIRDLLDHVWDQLPARYKCAECSYAFFEEYDASGTECQNPACDAWVFPAD